MKFGLLCFITLLFLVSCEENVSSNGENDSESMSSSSKLSSLEMSSSISNDSIEPPEIIDTMQTSDSLNNLDTSLSIDSLPETPQRDGGGYGVDMSPDSSFIQNQDSIWSVSLFFQVDKWEAGCAGWIGDPDCFPIGPVYYEDSEVFFTRYLKNTTINLDSQLVKSNQIVDVVDGIHYGTEYIVSLQLTKQVDSIRIDSIQWIESVNYGGAKFKQSYSWMIPLN